MQAFKRGVQVMVEEIKELSLQGITTGFIGSFLILCSVYVIDKLKHFFNIITK